MVEEVPGGDGFGGDDTVADVLNGLGDGVKKNNLRGDFAGGGDHGNGVDNWDGVEKSLDEDVPDGGDVAIFDIDGAEQKSETKGEKIELDDGRDGEEPGWAWGNAVDEGEDDNDDEVNQHVNDGGECGGDDDDVLWEADFSEQVAAIHNGLDALGSTFSEEAPHGSAA